MESACGLRDGSVLFLRNTIRTALCLPSLEFAHRSPTRESSWRSPGNTLTQITISKRSPPRRTGKEVVAVRGVNGHPNVYVADLPPARQYPRFTHIRRLTFTDADEYPHSWTPDSRSVIFESFRNGNFDLFRQNIDQSDAHPLVVSKDATVLAHVSPDGKWILYNQQHDGAVECDADSV